jgi:arginyl-tRNA synthetase
VLRGWGGEVASLAEAPVDSLGTPHEVALAQALAEFPAVLERAAREFSPHLVSFFLHDELAARLHTYYNAERFLVGTRGHARLPSSPQPDRRSPTASPPWA